MWIHTCPGGALADGLCPKAQGAHPAGLVGIQPPMPEPYLQCGAQQDLLHLWSLWKKASARRRRGGSLWPPAPIEELGRKMGKGIPANSGLFLASDPSLKPIPSLFLSTLALAADI